MELDIESNIVIHNQDEFKKMRKAGLLASKVLDYITPYVQPGCTTEYLDMKCHDFIINNNAIPAPLNYRGFPKSICTSINLSLIHISEPTRPY